MEHLWNALWSFGLLLLWGGLLALVTVLLPRVLDYFEPAPLSAPLGVPPRERPAPAVPAPAPPPEPPPAPEVLPVRIAAPVEDPALAAAVGLALALFLRGAVPAGELPPAPGGPGNIWALSGRWQIMQQRRGVCTRS